MRSAFMPFNPIRRMLHVQVAREEAHDLLLSMSMYLILILFLGPLFGGACV